MAGVNSALHLVAQRQALLELESVNSGYTELIACWLETLSPEESAALKGYDRMVEVYKVTAPPPANVPNNVH